MLESKTKNMLALKSLIVWAAIVVLAILNGILREAVLTPMLGITAGLLLSGLLLSALIIAVSYLTLPWLDARRLAQLLAVGLGWVLLTLVFEFSFGLWQGKSWSVLLEAYTFKDGNIWPLVLLVTALAPYIAARLRARV
ncbi:hypothetical protein [Arsukibacterium perlucidum]|uniref:hypothetical protein n=1 Tax=Arsukibacterium perlucidum TaxID=368811 RepID=UPI000377597D|nr:hypothetical protein [Arsukibacterium perlucidum]